MDTDDLEQLACEVDRHRTGVGGPPPTPRSAPLAWGVSLGAHAALVTAGLYFLSPHFRPPRAEYALGEQAVFVPNVWLASDETPTPSPKPGPPAAEPETEPEIVTAPESPPLFQRVESELPAFEETAEIEPLDSADPVPPEPVVPPAAVELPSDTPQAAPESALLGGDAPTNLPEDPPASESPVKAGVAPESGQDLAEPAQVSRGVPTGVVLVERSVPGYPEESLRAGEEGLVVLRVEVRADGSVGEVEMVRDPGLPRLVEAAINAARRSRFRPAMEGDRPVDAYVEVPYRFTIRKRLK